MLAVAAAMLQPTAARAQVGDGITETASITEAIVFTPPAVTLRRIDTFSTRIIGRLQGGTVFDQSFAVAFADPAVQGGVASAILAITTRGGPGVVIAAPARTQRTETLTSSVSTSLFTLNRIAETVTVTTAVGPTTISIVRFPTPPATPPCFAAVQDLPSSTRPVCPPATPTPVTIPDGTININTNVESTYFVDETRSQTDTYLTFEQYEINGNVVAIGTVHAAVQSGLFDLGGRLLRRLGEAEADGLWGDAYGMRVRHGDRRLTSGLAAGYSLAAAPGLRLTMAVDHGWVDIDVPGALEAGDLQLTEIGASARLDRGPFSAALSGVYGFGSADTLRSIAGASRADYDVRLAGASLDVGYTLDAGRGWRISPVAGLDHVRIRSDRFTETDALGLVAGDHDADRTRASAGVEIDHHTGAVALSASARYVAILDGDERILPVAFAVAPGTTLLMEGSREPDTAQFGVHAQFTVAPGAAIAIGYDGRFGDDYEGHAASLGLSIIL
jgi:hypothetical protein